MNQHFKRLVGLFLCLSMLLSTSMLSFANTGVKSEENSSSSASTYMKMVYPVPTQAQEMNPRYLGLTGCMTGISGTPTGLTVSYSTGFTKTASEIGVKNVKLQVKNGLSWSTISTIDKRSNTNSPSYLGGFSVDLAQNKREYRVSITYYAIYEGQTYTLPSTTESYVY